MGVQMEDEIQAGMWADWSRTLLLLLGFLGFPPLFFGGGDGVDIPAEASKVQGGGLRNVPTKRQPPRATALPAFPTFPVFPAHITVLVQRESDA